MTSENSIPMGDLGRAAHELYAAVASLRSARGVLGPVVRLDMIHDIERMAIAADEAFDAAVFTAHAEACAKTAKPDLEASP